MKASKTTMCGTQENIMRHLLLTVLIIASLYRTGWGDVALSQPGRSVSMVRGGKSAFSILYATNAPSSVKTAAQDLQSYIQKSTGARLPLITSNAVPNSP